MKRREYNHQKIKTTTKERKHIRNNEADEAAKWKKMGEQADRRD